jgi:ABC-type sugar transport system ATPase subunit
MERNTILRAVGISKGFPGVKALDSVDLDLKEGEVHALVGENGAGKSTLMNILSGILKPDSGFVELYGKRVSIADASHANELGINTVFQELTLFRT